MEMNIPLNAEVHCQDGICGDAKGVIVDPRSQQVTHFVVKNRRSPHNEKLVPGILVNETTVNTIELCLRTEELASMENYEETRFEHADTERIPPGELAIRRGIKVFATDGPTGNVDEFLIDSDDGRITHIIMRAGRLWNKKEVIIPGSFIARIDQYRVYLNLDKRRVRTLPATLLRRWF
jgi:hypothetical protein